MKQTFLLLVAALTVVTCGKSDDSNGSKGGNISIGKFSPPKWIQGSWTTANKTTTPIRSVTKSTLFHILSFLKK